jgi:hypothetical protein
MHSNGSLITLSEIIQDRRSGIPIKEKDKFKNKNKKTAPKEANKYEKWEFHDQILFFKSLKIFGTDFSMMALVLKNKNRQ